ncbi:membrane protein [Actinoplanes sp. OR16]|uniref:anthrone oxygenase family protein n=1 Tax=Actinoplanes sp. OR16 TaxID=946334 RepID=UPI000F70B300|nr:anthrone oxygenase family protein [Actinoplanes sp. OR16]BBH70199.1 membrane protein [Actinoplanes sp. OR16]
MSASTTVLTSGALVGTAAVGGVFFAFSTFVMSGLGAAGERHAVPAMQAINVTAVRPPLMILLFGTLVVTGVAAVMQGRQNGWGTATTLTVVAFAVYLVGVVGVTAFGNVPLNNRLVALGESFSPGDWPAYARPWTLLNHIRTIASLISAGLLAAALRLV